ncbi:PREDICTED: uncharacterized protein LOC109341365 [Lupinus angustifolius]|uniref:uncharacterized protein LOC109341365 n=1 Tax=Lupinus angustifolius TaxID=3871 RepID=UPI00092E2311|nr:PREDICTED: uncharacterized protein LOC109341365 [Lupinus angustifolius]
MPTDENLKARGLAMGSSEESSNHLFFQYSFSRAIWRGLGTQTGCGLDTSSITSLLLISYCWSPLVKEVLVACILNAISTIWYYRNKSRFDNIVFSLAHAMTRIKVDTAFTRDFSKLYAKNSMAELFLLTTFKVKGNYNKAPSITEVMWQAPSLGWVKVNSDGIAHGCAGHAGGGGIFRNSNGGFMGSFASYFNIQNHLYAELLGIYSKGGIVTIAHSKGWNLL